MTPVLQPGPLLETLPPPVRSATVAGGETWAWSLPDAPAADPWLAWLGTRPERQRWFVQSEPDTWDLGAGVARRLDLQDAVDTELPAGLLLWPCWPAGGHERDPHWGELDRPALWEPVLAVQCRNGVGRITWTPSATCSTPEDATRELVDWLGAGMEHPAAMDAPLEVLSVSESPRHAWDDGVAQVLEACREHTLRKAVLGCWREWQLAVAPDPLALLRRLPAGTSTRLLVEDGAGTAFLALSPEFLYRRRGSRLVCDALAGTRPCGDSSAARRAHAEELLASGKDRREQALVASGLQHDLQHAGAGSVKAGPVAVHVAGSLQHLRSTVTAVAPAGGDLALIRALHPTPALGGEPRDTARVLLQELEGFRRGLYGGLVGVVGSGRADLSVGIRSARMCGTRLRLYAGAGLVPGSVAADEWQETRHKLAVLEGALGLVPPAGSGGERTLR